MSSLGVLDPCVATCLGELFINNVSMNTPAWNVMTVIPLIGDSPNTRGDNVTVGGLAGQQAYPMEVEQTDYILPMMVSGTVDSSGNVDSDGIWARLFRNFAELRANVYGPVDGVTATWYSVIVAPWGDSYEANIQVLDIGEVYENRAQVKTNITIRVPVGEYTLVP